MASVPTKTRDPREKPRRAIKNALGLRKRAPRTEQVRKIARDLKKVGKAGAKNKLPDATSDHAFLYGDGGAPV